jgi:hypothetical protein
MLWGSPCAEPSKKGSLRARYEFGQLKFVFGELWGEVSKARWRMVGSHFRLGFRAMASSALLALEQNRFLAHWVAHWGQAPGDLADTGDRPPAIWRTRGTGTGRFGAILAGRRARSLNPKQSTGNQPQLNRFSPSTTFPG